MQNSIPSTPIQTKSAADDIFNLDFSNVGNNNNNNNHNGQINGGANNDLLMLNGGNPFLQNLVSQSYGTAPSFQQQQNPFSQMPAQTSSFQSLPNQMAINSNAKLGNLNFCCIPNSIYP